MKKFVSEIAISFFFTSIFIIAFHFFLEPYVNEKIMLINSISVKDNVTVLKEEYDLTSKRLIHYPAYGSKYATIKIPSINLSMPVYHGDTKKILLMGIGHYTGSYFPGEKGTIIYAGHNDTGYLANLYKVKIDDIITILTNYGTFNYEVTEIRIVNENDLEAFKVQNNEEVLLLYTCYPMDNSIIGRKTERMVLYAKRVNDEEI